MPIDDLEYKTQASSAQLAPYVESIWMLQSHAATPREMVLLPDGRVDVIFSASAEEPFHVMLMGLETVAEQTIFAAGMKLFAVSLKLPGVECLLQTEVRVGENKLLPNDFWEIEAADLADFDVFYNKVSNKLLSRITTPADERKLKLFELIYSSNGSISVTELSKQTYWSSRQINRYFNQHFGLSLKAYCNILRFRASFQHIKDGRLFPEEAFADQSHFIKNVKKYAGVAPKELSKNKNDRFIQFSTLNRK